MAEWYVRTNNASSPNGEAGPFSNVQIRQLVQDGRIRPDTMIRRSDMTQSVPAQAIKGLFPEQELKIVGLDDAPKPSPQAPLASSPTVFDPFGHLNKGKAAPVDEADEEDEKEPSTHGSSKTPLIIAGSAIGAVALVATLVLSLGSGPKQTADLQEPVATSPGVETHGATVQVTPASLEPTQASRPIAQPVPTPVTVAASTPSAPLVVTIEASAAAAEGVSTPDSLGIGLVIAKVETAIAIGVRSTPGRSLNVASMPEGARPAIPDRAYPTTPDRERPPSPEGVRHPPVTFVRAMSSMGNSRWVVVRFTTAQSLIELGDIYASIADVTGAVRSQPMPTQYFGLKNDAIVAGVPLALADLAFTSQLESPQTAEIVALAWRVPLSSANIVLTRRDPTTGAEVAVTKAVMTPDELKEAEKRNDVAKQERSERERIFQDQQQARQTEQRLKEEAAEAFDGQITFELPIKPRATTTEDALVVNQGRHLVVALEDNRIAVVDLSDGKLTGTTEIFGDRFEFAAGGNRLVVCDSSSQLTKVLELPSLEKVAIRPLDPSDKPHVMAMGSESSTTYVCERQRNGEHLLDVMDVETGATLRTIKIRPYSDHQALPPENERFLAISPDGRYALMSGLYDLQEGVLIGNLAQSNSLFFGGTEHRAFSGGVRSAQQHGVTKDGIPLFRDFATSTLGCPDLSVVGPEIIPTHYQLTNRAFPKSPKITKIAIPTSDGGAFIMIDDQGRFQMFLEGKGEPLADLGLRLKDTAGRADSEWLDLCWASLESRRFLSASPSGIRWAIRPIPTTQATEQLISAPVPDLVPPLVRPGIPWKFQITCLAEKPTFKLMSGPRGLTCSANGELSWKPQDGLAQIGSHQVIVTAKAPGFRERDLSFQVTVVPAPAAGMSPMAVEFGGKPHLIWATNSNLAHCVSLRSDEEILVHDGARIHVFPSDGSRVIRSMLGKESYQGFHALDREVLASHAGGFDLIDLNSLMVTRSIPWEGRLGEIQSVAVDAKNRIAYVAARLKALQPGKTELEAQPIYRIDLKTGALAEIPGAFGSHLAVHPSGEWVFATVKISTSLGKQTVIDYYGDAWVVERSISGDFLTSYAVRNDRLAPNQVVSVRDRTYDLGPTQVLTMPGDGNALMLRGRSGFPFWVDPSDLEKDFYPRVTQNRSTADIAGMTVADHGSALAAFITRERALLLFNRQTGSYVSIPFAMQRQGYIPTLAFASKGRSLAIGIRPEAHYSEKSTWIGSVLFLPEIANRPELANAKAPSMSKALPDPRRIALPKLTLPDEPKTPVATTPTPASGKADNAQTEGSTTIFLKPKRADLSSLTSLSRSNKDPAAIAQGFQDSVVLIRAAGGFGSGFFIGRNGWVLTCAHVLGNGKVTVEHGKNNEASTTYEATVAAVDHEHDLALIKIEANQVPYVPLNLTQAPPLGEAVVVIGNPGVGRTVLERTLTTGVISSANRTLNGQSFIQTNAAVNPGNSGGPIFDSKGNVFGVMVLKAGIEGASFAVSPERVKAFLDRCLGP